MTDPKDIKAIAFDIDGVISDGAVIPLADGDLIRVFDAKDAFAIRQIPAKGLISAIFSGGDTEALRKRMLHLAIKPEHLFLGCRGKLAIFKKWCADNNLQPSEVAYFGDDIPDTQVLRACGIGFAPADAVDEAKEAADIVCTKPAGHGAVREGIEMILKAQGRWVFDPEKFDQLF